MCANACIAFVNGWMGIIGAIAGNITGALLGYKLALWRDVKEARGRFRAAFYETKAALNSGNYDNMLIRRSATAHEIAIGTFEAYLKPKAVSNFRRDCEEYRKHRQLAQNHEQVAPPIPQQVINDLLKSIDKLLTYAE